MNSVFRFLILSALTLISCGAMPLDREIRKSADALDQAAYDSSFFFINKKEHMFEPTVKLTLSEKMTTFMGFDLGEPIFVPVSSATGFAFKWNKQTNRTYILTNNHFCEDLFFLDGIITAETGSMMKEKDTSFIGMEAALEFTDPQYDLCVVSVGVKLTTVSFENEKSKLKPMDELTIVGAPMGVYPIIINTSFSQYVPRLWGALGDMNTEGNDFLMVSSIIMPGSSGSPVFNDSGKVVGIIYSGSQSQGLPIYGGMAIPVADINLFLSSDELEHIY